MPTALTENRSLLPTPRSGSSQAPVTPASRDLTCTLALLALYTGAYILTQTHNLKNKPKKCTRSFVIMQTLLLPVPTEVATMCLKIWSIFTPSFWSACLSTPSPRLISVATTSSSSFSKNADIDDLPHSWSSWENYSPWRILAQGFVDIFDHFHDFTTWHTVFIGWLSNKESN